MRQSVALYQRGFSILELILAVTLILAVAAVVVPAPAGEPLSKDQQVAHNDCEAIAQGLTSFQRDVGHPPLGHGGKRTFTWLRGPGQDPMFMKHPGGVAGDLEWFLASDKMTSKDKWGGPYVDGLKADPWGRRVVVIVPGPDAEPQASVWVLSAGSDGVIETGPLDSLPVGDDVGIMLENF